MIKIKAKILLFLTSGAISLNASTIDGISTIVNNEPITLSEINKISHSLKLPTKNALDILIIQRLKDAQIKSLSIEASSFEIKEKMEEFAQRNSLSLRDFENLILSKGRTIEEAEEEVANQIKQDKLYKRVFATNIQTPTEDMLKSFYEQNLEKFKLAQNFEVTKFSAPAFYLLEKKLNSPLMDVDGVEVKNITLKRADLGPKMLYILDGMNPNNFTPIMQDKNEYVMFFLSSKKDFKTPKFDQISNIVLDVFHKQQQEEVIKDYFDKLKAKADIKIIRYP